MVAFERTSPGTVTVTLTYDEALLLFEMTHRWDDADLGEQLCPDPTERLVLSRLAGGLDPIIDEVFSSDYADVIARARASLAAEGSCVEEDPWVPDEKPWDHLDE